MTWVAVIPAAGLGTRMENLTSGSAKELLRVGGKPILEWVVYDALAAGAAQVRVVGTSRKPDIAAFVAGLADERVVLCDQPEPLGLGDAIRCGLVSGLPAMALMADTIYATDSPTSLLVEALENGAWMALPLREAGVEELPSKGVAAIYKGQVTAFVEKPAPGDEPGSWVVSARFGFSAEAVVRMLENPSLPEVIQSGIADGQRIAAIEMPPGARLYDCGTPTGYREAIEVMG